MERLIDYIKELEIRLLTKGESLPAMREDVIELLNDGELKTDLIRMSSKTGIRILTTDKDRKMFLMSESQRLGLDMILPPLTAEGSD